jgi:hypothetical protein
MRHDTPTLESLLLPNFISRESVFFVTRSRRKRTYLFYRFKETAQCSTNYEPWVLSNWIMDLEETYSPLVENWKWKRAWRRKNTISKFVSTNPQWIIEVTVKQRKKTNLIIPRSCVQIQSQPKHISYRILIHHSIQTITIFLSSFLMHHANRQNKIKIKP